MKNKVTLYIATHNKTGLKYFGKTTRYFTEEDLQSNYHGSGTYWKNHIRKHGDDITMEIYGIYSIDENAEDYVEPIALKFSEENNIVENRTIWANIIPEDGLDTGGNTGYKHSDETKEKQRDYAKNNKHSDKTKEKIGKSVSIKLKGRVFTEEHKNNMRVKSGKQKIIICPHCKKEGGATGMKRWHFDNCKKLSII